MKAVLLIAGLVALASAGSVPPSPQYETKDVSEEFAYKQKKVLSLLQHVNQVDPQLEYYKVGKDFDIYANMDQFTNKKAVEEFMYYYRHGYLPKGQIFSVFYERMREEAIALYHLLHYAKDFETFYKTAAWARVHLNEGLFTYSFCIAVLHREDTQGIILPAPYEIYPYFFVNSEVIEKMYRLKMQNGLVDPSVGYYYGITHEGNEFTIYANYSGRYSWTLGTEQRLSYYTEDIGLNTYYYYFHAQFPFWMQGEEYGNFKERRGEYYFYFHQQLLARYYMERLTNGLGEIPRFSWRTPIKTGYYPNMFYRTGTPFPQRNNYYYVQNPENALDIQYVESYEAQFLEYLHEGQYEAFEHKYDLRKPKSINFVGNYWQTNPDSRDKSYKNFNKYYEVIARVLLGGSPYPVNDYYAYPSVLEQFQTSLRDPVFFQLYKRIIYYFIQYKQYLEPYTKEQLYFNGVKVTDVQVEKLETYYEYFDFDATNGLYYSKEESNNFPYYFKVRQPRLNHKPFNVQIEVKSDVSTDAVFKIFMVPKYDGAGNVITLEHNWMNFYELDWFTHKLTPGKNTIERNSREFFYFKEDSIPARDIFKMCEEKKVPKDMSEDYNVMPNRLMLPKGTYGGFPFQFFVFVYPYTPLEKEYANYQDFLLDNKPFGFPFDRPIDARYFYQPNMYFKDVQVYQVGEYFSYTFNTPQYFYHHNEVPKH
uniref:Arylphorin 1 n=1 Tax=Tineola bisselliella TaxID=93883 RepID=A0A891XJ54_TINBI|nr:arylphorin 1 [Tineola bisselliella]